MLDILISFLAENQIIAVIITCSGLVSLVFGGLAAVFWKKSNLNLEALNAIDANNKKLKIKLIAAQSLLKIYDPNLFAQRINALTADSAPEGEPQKTAEAYFFHQNKAITEAALYLAKKAAQNVGVMARSPCMRPNAGCRLGFLPPRATTR